MCELMCDMHDDVICRHNRCIPKERNLIDGDLLTHTPVTALLTWHRETSSTMLVVGRASPARHGEGKSPRLAAACRVRGGGPRPTLATQAQEEGRHHEAQQLATGFMGGVPISSELSNRSIMSPKHMQKNK